MNIVALCLAVLMWCSVPAFAQDLNVDDMLSQMKSSMDLGFKQQDVIKPILSKYVNVIKFLREQGGASNEKLLKGQIMVMNQQLERELKGVLSAEQMDAFKSIKRSLLAS